MIYKLIKNIFTGEVDKVLRIKDLSYIPFVPDNTDYQAYLKWLSEGNTPLPADASIEVNTSTTADDNTGAA